MIAYGHLRFKIYGLMTPGTPDSDVDARAFSEKLSILLAALGAADRAANGKVMHDYKIVHSEVSSMALEVRESLRPRYRKRPPETSISAFTNCMSAVAEGRRDAAQKYGRCSQLIGRLGRGAGQRFAYGELWAKSPQPFRIDEVLAEQAASVNAPPDIDKSSEETWFCGFVYCSFDGAIKEVDFRGSLPQGKLILSAGGKQIDCIFRGVEEEQIRVAVNRRVRIQGRAFYDGKSGLPRRIDITAPPEVIKVPGDFTKWRGAFAPFGAATWDDVQ